MSMIISPTDFVFNGMLFYRNLTGRCYLLVEPSNPSGKVARRGLLASKRISLEYYNECLAACRQILSGGAA
jgi:hypothetical protein